MERKSKSLKIFLSLLMLGIPLINHLSINAYERGSGNLFRNPDLDYAYLGDIDDEWDEAYLDFDFDDDFWLDELDDWDDWDLESIDLEYEYQTESINEEEFRPTTAVIIGSEATIYQEPDQEALPSIIPLNTNVQILQTNEDWYQIYVANTTGWIHKSNIQITIQIAVILNDNVEFKEEASHDAAVLKYIPSGSKVLVKDQTDDMIKTLINDEIGWLYQEDLAINEGRRPGVVVAETILHNLPDEQSESVTFLALDDEIMIIQRTKTEDSEIAWYQISINDEELGMLTGWIKATELIYSNHFRFISSEVEEVPLVNFTRIAQHDKKIIPPASLVTVLAQVGAWSHISYVANYEVLNGWVATDALTAELENEQPFAQAVPTNSITTLRHTGVTVIDNVAFRSGPGSNYAILGRIPANTSVRITGRLGSWNRIVHSGETVWVRRSNLRRTVQRAVFRGDRVPVHSSPNSTSGVLTHATRGTRVTISQRTRLWARVSINGHSGWVRTNQLRIANGRAPGRITGSGTVNLHQRPNANSPINRRVSAGKEVMMIQRTTNGNAATAGWTQVVVIDAADRSHIGWVRTDRVQLSNHQRVFGGTSQAPVRQGPGASFAQNGNITRNTPVTVLAEIGTWSRIRFTRNGNRQYGWVRSNRVRPIYTMHSEIETAIRNLQGGRSGIGISYFCLVTERRISVNGNRSFFGASTIKLPTNMLVAEAVRDGRLSWNQRLTIQQSDWLGGSGVLQHRARVGQQLTISELMRHSIVYSDNIAHRMLARAVIPGFQNESVGLDNSRMQLTNAVFDRYLRNHQRPSSRMIFTPNQAVDIFRTLYNDRNRVAGYDTIIRHMRNTSWNDRFKTNQTRNHVAHTPAWTHPFQHDSGIFFTDNPYILVVYTEGVGGVPFLSRAADDIFSINRRFRN